MTAVSNDNGRDELRRGPAFECLVERGVLPVAERCYGGVRITFWTPKSLDTVEGPTLELAAARALEYLKGDRVDIPPGTRYPGRRPGKGRR